MKKHLLILFVILLLTANTFAKTAPGSGKDFKQQQSTGIGFTENKGQVHDQNYQPRPDVLYGAMTGNMAVHIKNSGVSYQLYRVDHYTEVEDPKTNEKHRRPEQQTIYRIDLNWLNHNTNFTQTQDEALPGYSNYYLENCPEGALNVTSYTGVTLKNLYNGINLHYYQKNGELKHDYIVAPYADYKQIQLRVEGADVSLNADGSLILTTPLGKVQEGAPVVYQNGKQLRARWLILVTEFGRSVSFDIENYNHAYELIIDPVTRMWGTYYGGSGEEYRGYCATDGLGNVYLAGATTSNTSTLIATSGSHQSSYGGGFTDAFLIKFNSSGARQWGSYYGGAGDDEINSCATDVAGNVYMAGYTTSITTTFMTTTGSHQTAFGGNYYDAFLIKFNGSGVRQWGTYYGGTGNDFGFCCATDNSGNVYLTGSTTSSTGTVIATVGSHQPVAGGDRDAFLVKFSSSGVRQWCTYYGGVTADQGYACTTDAAGNVYMSGVTSTGVTTVIATISAHQPVMSGGGDAFLVKFNSSGVRQWGTYYGGLQGDWGQSCVTDAAGNVYMAGNTNSNSSSTPVSIASAGSHQQTYGGGNVDAFFVKFNTNGVRQWGTFYGGMNEEYPYSCATDASGNVYFAGGTNASTGTIIATNGSYQPVSGGFEDSFLVKFNSSGIRQWGTYYGGTGGDGAFSCVTDGLGNTYMSGQTNTNAGTAMASIGSHQATYGGGGCECYLVKFDACEIAPALPLSLVGPTAMCAGATVSYSTPVLPGANSYTLWLPPGMSASSNNNTITVTPVASGVFTLVAGNSCGISPQQTLNVTVNALPAITASTNIVLLCVGESATLTASGASTYTFSPGGAGANITISPTVTSSYTLNGIDANGCGNTVIVTQSVDACMGLYQLSSINYRLSIYPNPTTGILNLELDSDQDVIIMNAIGQIVYSCKLSSGSHRINVENLAKGIYVVKPGNAGGSKNLKMIKE